MNNQLNTVFQVLCLMQVALEKLEDMPDGNIFKENNYDRIHDFINYLEFNVETLTEKMEFKESDRYIYICNRLRKDVERIKLD